MKTFYQIVYLASAENKSLIGNIKMLNYGIECALENELEAC